MFISQPTCFSTWAITQKQIYMPHATLQICWDFKFQNFQLAQASIKRDPVADDENNVSPVLKACTQNRVVQPDVLNHNCQSACSKAKHYKNVCGSVIHLPSICPSIKIFSKDPSSLSFHYRYKISKIPYYCFQRVTCFHMT